MKPIAPEAPSEREWFTPVWVVPLFLIALAVAYALLR
jgi:hypothetical protein